MTRFSRAPRGKSTRHATVPVLCGECSPILDARASGRGANQGCVLSVTVLPRSRAARPIASFGRQVAALAGPPKQVVRDAGRGWRSWNSGATTVPRGRAVGPHAGLAAADRIAPIPRLVVTRVVPPERGAAWDLRAMAGSPARGSRRSAPVWTCARAATSAITRLVRKGGLEPPRLAALVPKTRASTNSATFASCPGAPGRGMVVDRRGSWTPRPARAPPVAGLPLIAGGARVSGNACGPRSSPWAGSGAASPATKNARQCRALPSNWWAVKDSNLGPID